ncbi:MAG: glucosaminidase domain-containing protein [Actinomycetota bacterium]
MPLTPFRTLRSRRLAPGLVAAALAAGALIGSGGPATAQTAAPSPTLSGTAARVAHERTIVEAAIRLSRSRAELGELERALADVTARHAAAERVLRETDDRLAQVRTRVVEIRAALQARAAVVYRTRGDRLGMILSVDRTASLAAGDHYAASVAVVDDREMVRLQGLVPALEQQRAEQDVVRRGLADQQARLDGGRADRQATVDRQQSEVDRLGGVPVMGSPVLTGADLAAWFASTGRRARLMDDTPIEDLAETYVGEASAERVRGDLAFAQAVLETGGFAHAADSNFAGIGACDSCTSQYRFPSPRDGVRAHIQLLRNYADPLSRAATLANPPEVTLHGSDPVRAARAFDTFPFKGRAPLWNVMGAGNWASDPDYARKVLSLYAQMLAFTASRSA